MFLMWIGIERFKADSRPNPGLLHTPNGVLTRTEVFEFTGQHAGRTVRAMRRARGASPFQTERTNK